MQFEKQNKRSQDSGRCVDRTVLVRAGLWHWVPHAEVNPDMDNTDVCLVVGANDITNCAAQDDPESPIAGMPVIEVWKAKTCVFMKRSMAAGCPGAAVRESGERCFLLRMLSTRRVDLSGAAALLCEHLLLPQCHWMVPGTLTSTTRSSSRRTRRCFWVTRRRCTLVCLSERAFATVASMSH